MDAKVFIDRWYAMARDPFVQQMEGKRVAFLFAFGDDHPSTAGHADGMLTCSMDYLQMPIVGRVFASAWKRGDIYNSPEKLDEAYQLGRAIVTAETGAFSEKGRSPTVLGVFQPKTANAIGLLPTRRLLHDFPRELTVERRWKI